MQTGGSDSFVAHGDAGVLDAHLLSDVHCVDAGIVKWLASRRRRWKLAKVAPLIARKGEAGLWRAGRGEQ
jgi:hypothetical protein